jgi:MYXO-CTERM domain-containing protein
MRRAIPALSLIVWASSTWAAVTLQAGSTTVANSGGRAEVCISLRSGGAEIAGTQNDLVWDGSCATLPDTHACAGSAGTGKELLGALNPQGRDFAYRALVLSLSDVNPIPDGTLYCCAFTVEADPGECCSIDVVNAGASDPLGNAISVTGVGGQVCVAGSAASGSPTPTATPDPSAAADNGGCQVAPASSQVPAALLGLGVALALAARRARR